MWESDDGAHWRLVTEHGGWQARHGHSTAVWRNVLCVVGGLDERRVFNDVWCSQDGGTWSQLNAGALTGDR